MKLLEKLECVNDLSVKIKLVDRYVNRLIYFGTVNDVPYGLIKNLFWNSIEHHYDYIEITVY